ncbi:hybrid sensor histidine kinase/response regulator transcription factor [Flavivirga algicola]|uniref:histidine kinase n=1 Tax=Flavivirga algicola TaxID=2729136 RepID=A0ABX1S2B2_9FLAO|nr:response regulator [Flavivirga algicola]NMH88564.1 response regulator [Flavivirga algicola]
MLKKILNLLTTYFTLGADENTSINDLKKITLLHIFCNTWHLFTILTFIGDFYNNQLLLMSYAVMLSFVISVQVLLYLKKLLAASLLFIFNLSVTAFIFSNYLYVGELLEYYFLLPPAIALIYIDNRKLNIAILVICLLGLYVPNLYFDHYPHSVLNNKNPPFLFFSIFIVISYFKNLNIRNEKILKAKTEQLEELDKFKSQFFTNISHEIRTPLALINGHISDLDLVPNSPRTQEIQQNVKKQIHKITDMVDSVLDLAKIQSSNFSLQLKLTNVSNLIRKQYMYFEPLFSQKNIAFHISDNTTDYYSFIDTVFFEKAMNNLIINALKYTHEGKVAIDSYEENGQLVLKISDTGIGIANSEFESIFNRFYQINNDINKSGGSGVGLAFCKEIIELHQGKISLKSELNKGSIFTIVLPLEKSLPNVIVQDKVSIKKAEKTKVTENVLVNNSRYRFLIVDDNYDMRKYLISILENHFCLEASNGLEALEIIAQNTIDFIITDYMMPKLNGYDLVSELNRNNSHIPVIMLTAKTNMDAKLDVLKLGIDDYITKPFDKGELLTRIDNCIKNYASRSLYNKEHDINVEDLKKDLFIDQLKEYIMENSNSTFLNQDMIALEFNISKSSFYRKIKSNTGLSPNNFIREIKLQKARGILQNNQNISLKELSFEVGFNHISYFSKIYERRFGVKPLNDR